MCFAPQRRALFRHLDLQKWSEPLVFCTFWLRNVLRATTACTFSTSQLPKVVRTPIAFYILTWKCASRHNGVHFFDISTAKSGPELVCFVHVDFEMSFAPQRRPLFRHLNCQKWSAPLVFCTFWLWNVFRATMACNFSSLIWPHGSAPAALASLLFDPPEPQIIGKTQWIATFLPFRASASSFFWLFLFSDLLLLLNTVNRDFPTFSRICIFFLLTLSLLWPSLFWDSSHLYFSSVHIVGSLTSKLPSINNWSTSFQLLSPSLRCCSSPMYFQSSTGDSWSKPSKARKGWAKVSMYGYSVSWWHLMTMMCAVSRMCLHMSPYFIRPLTKDQLHPPSGSRELSKRHSQFSKCAHRPKSPTGCKSQSGLMRVQYLDADPRWSKGFWGVGSWGSLYCSSFKVLEMRENPGTNMLLAG